MKREDGAMDQWALLQVLTRYIDGELPPDRRGEVEALIDANPEIRTVADRLRAATNTVRAAVLRARQPDIGLADQAPGADCLADDLVMRLADGTAHPQEARRAEQHLRECNRCLARVLEGVRSAVSMTRAEWPELPPDVKQDRTIRALVHLRDAEPSTEAWETLVVPADLAKPERHHYVAGGLRIDLTVEPGRSGGAVAIDLRLRDPGSTGRRITLTDNATGRKLLSGRADRQGRFRAPRVGPGSHTIHFLGCTMKIDLTIEG